MRERAEEAFDEILEHRMRGEKVDIEAFLRARADLREDEREELRTLASTLDVSWVRDVLRPRSGKLPASIGPYRVLSRLGRGGQGEVYLAEDERTGRRTALKVLTTTDPTTDPHTNQQANSSSTGALARMRREVELVQRLDHPGICKLYECGTENGTHYVAMQYVEGETLERWITNTRERGEGLSAADVERALVVVEQAARALHEAHEAGVVHRDVKPGNLMLAPDGRVVLLDFGLAKGTTSDKVTQTGQILGSPAYLPPEQLAANGTEIDGRADVYSLGVSLYECLTLRRPFEAKDREQLFRQIREGGPPDPCRSNPRLDRNHRRLLEKALQPDRADRYPSALAFAEDLRRLRRGERLTARAPGPVRRAARRIRAHPRASAGLAMLAVLVGCLSLTWLFWRDTQEARTEAKGDNLLALARGQLASNPGLALLCAIEGAERAPGRTADNTLLDILGEQCERRMLRAHEKPLLRCVRGPGGRTWITASEDHTLRVWDAASWRLEQVLEGHKTGVLDAALSRDGKWLASLSNDGECWLWNTQDWSCVNVLSFGSVGEPRMPGFDARGRLLMADGQGVLQLWDTQRGVRHALGARGDELTGCSLDLSGKRALSLTRDGGLRVWELDAVPRLLFELPAREPGQFQAAGFDPEGENLLVVTTAGGASVFELATQHERPLESLEGATKAFAFAPGDGPVLVSRRDGSVGLWDARSGAYLRELRDNPSPIHEALFTADGARVVTCSGDSKARLWDTASGNELEAFRGHESNVVNAFLDPAGDSLLTASYDGTLREWGLESEARRTTVLIGKHDLVSAHLDAEGERAVCAGDTGWVQVVELDSRRTTLEFRAAEQTLHEAVFAAGGSALLTASSDRTARLWDAASGAPIAVLQHPAPVWDAEESPDGLRIVTASEDGRARIWDARTQMLERELVGHEGGVRCARFVGDGSRILTCSESPWDASVRLWDATTGVQLLVLRTEGAQPNTVSTDPEGHYALAAGWWGSAQLWDLESGTLVRTWQAHESHIFGTAFRPDGSGMLTSSSSPIARQWSVVDGAEQMTLEDGRHIPSYVDFSRDGRWILTASSLGRLRLWPADPLERAHDIVSRELTPEDRARLGL